MIAGEAGVSGVDNEGWLLDEGERVLATIASRGRDPLDWRDRLIRCLWVADYGMRNAGDLTTAADLHPDFLREGRAAAEALGLMRATAAFSLPPSALERRYLALFDGIVTEIRAG